MFTAQNNNNNNEIQQYHVSYRCNNHVLTWALFIHCMPAMTMSCKIADNSLHCLIKFTHYTYAHGPRIRKSKSERDGEIMQTLLCLNGPSLFQIALPIEKHTDIGH